MYIWPFFMLYAYCKAFIVLSGIKFRILSWLFGLWDFGHCNEYRELVCLQLG
jgi:hypothetical protein